MTRPAVRETGHLDSAHPPAPCGLRAFFATVLILILILIVIPYGVDELSGGTTRLSLGPVLVMCVCQLRAPQFRLLAIPFPKSDDEPKEKPRPESDRRGFEKNHFRG